MPEYSLFHDESLRKCGGFVKLNMKEWANKGVLTKALKVFTDFCFKNYGFNKLFLRTHETNYPARKVAAHCGFEIEGTIRRDYKTTTGELVDLLCYGKILNN